MNALRRRYEAVKRAHRMSYGTLPPKDLLMGALARHNPYPMELVGADKRLANDLLSITPTPGRQHSFKDHYELPPAQMYGFLQDLTAAWHEGNEAAGDLASSILGTLGFEWI